MNATPEFCPMPEDSTGEELNLGLDQPPNIHTGFSATAEAIQRAQRGDSRSKEPTIIDQTQDEQPSNRSVSRQTSRANPKASIGVDTVEVQSVLPDDGNVPRFLLRPQGWSPIKTGVKRCPRLGRSVEYQGLCGPAGTYVGWVPETRELSLRLSIPRLAYPYDHPSANTPLRTCGPNTLQSLCLEVLYAIGRRVSAFGVDAVGILGLMDWAVVSCAFTADVPVSDTIDAMRALATLRRRHGRDAKLWVKDGAVTGFQWETTDRRFQIYDKGKQVLEDARGTHDEDRASLLRAVAANLGNVIRLEVTCRTARGVRDLFGLGGGRLPTLRRILESDVAGYALGQELSRLGLLSVAQLSRARVGEHRALGLEFLAARDRMEACGEKLGRHNNVRAGRLLQLLGYYYAARDFTPGEFATLWGLSDSARCELEADLRGLGLPPTLRKGRTIREVLTEIVLGMRPLVTQKRPVMDEADLRLAPWVRDDEADAVENFEDLLVEGGNK